VVDYAAGIQAPPRVGDHVTGRLWRGRIVEIQVAGRWFQTYAYPVAPPAWVPPLLIAAGLAVLTGTAAFVVRSLRAR
jgi:hypothetical protein